MAITDTTAIKFSNEQVRPLSETARALKAAIDSMLVDWYAGLNVVIPNDVGEILEDGRSAEGINTLTGADIHNLVAALAAISLNSEVVAKPCVRPLRVG